MEFVCTDGVVIGPDVVIGMETQILPGTILKGKTTIGTQCVIGPNSLVKDTTVGDRCVLNATQAYDSIIHEDVTIGPFAVSYTHLNRERNYHVWTCPGVARDSIF